MGSTCLHLDHIAPVVEELAPAHDGPVAGGGGPARGVPAQPETVARVDDEGRGIDVAGTSLTALGGNGRLGGPVDRLGAHPREADPAGQYDGGHRQRGHHQDASQQDPETHDRCPASTPSAPMDGRRGSSIVDPLGLVMTYTWLCVSLPVWPTNATGGPGTAGVPGQVPIKCRNRPADATRMEVRPAPEQSEQSELSEPSEQSDHIAVLLRAKYRCERCYKNCQVPCRFTGSEFRRLVGAVRSICEGDDHQVSGQTNEPPAPPVSTLA